MPNWCENLLYVQGDEKEIERFMEFAKADDIKTNEDNKEQLIDFDKFVPYPEEEKYKERLKWLKYQLKQCKTDEEIENLKIKEKITDEMIKEMMLLSLEEDDYNGWDILSWHTAHWGTKWNAYFYDDKFKKFDTDLVEYHFDTAWGPSIPVTMAMSGLFPKLIFTHLYAEPGMDFSGFVRFENGSSIEDSHNKLKRNWDCPKMKFKKWKLDKIYKQEKSKE